MTTIAIVGAGFSGTLLCLHLLRHCPPSTRLVLIERHSQFGRGLAYSTGNPSHILNVPAARMSAFHDRPGDFVAWLSTQPEAASLGPDSFAPRRLFGAYIRALLNEELKRSGRDRLELVRGNVVGIDRGNPRLALQLERGDPIPAEIAVLAVGNFPPEPSAVPNRAFYDTPFYSGDPWSPAALDGLPPDAPVLLLGTGLTAVDVAISLLDRKHTGPIHAISRRGLLPRRHASVPAHTPEHAPFPTSVNDLARFLRREAARAAAQGSSWQPIIDELRPFTVDIWQTMPLRDRDRFLRHLRPWWEVHRHRMAPEVADRIEAARAAGQFHLLIGRVRDYAEQDGRVTVFYRPRGKEQPEQLEVARVINCAGPSADYDRMPDPLVRTLLTDGTARPDPLRLGLDVTTNCALLHRDGSISRRIFAVGPVTKGAFWEMTAVPDIRRQTEKLAEHLAALVKARPVARVL